MTVDCIVSIDVAETKFVAAIATRAGDVLKLDAEQLEDEVERVACFGGLLECAKQIAPGMSLIPRAG